MAQAMINFRMDEELKKNMEETCKDLGLSMTTGAWYACAGFR